MPEPSVLSADETAQEIADWMADALLKIGANELDESVLSVVMHGCIVRLEARVTRREGQ